ncbi:excinuclease ABC subunit UvrA [Thermonema rossianum]|uniref:excinuclease ABC subunit UvrA n=1 Tax=Thermonema rossianum TaxID=55505 RepID=UPI00056FCFD6|nr:excinuclease ABC subunit UvrA [Thermonema rossianum]
MEQFIRVSGARVHNLKNIDIDIPRFRLVVITGVSGSGKSSLVFDTLYAEGQRRYLESFASYARNFLGTLERPDVDSIEGLSPVIAIEQKTTSRNPRSTVGTTTEIYDYLRLLYARAAEAYSYVTGKKMVRQSEDQITNSILERFAGQKIQLLAPLVRGRKGHYRELFKKLEKSGYTKVRVDGEVRDIEPKMQLDRYKIHDIELVIDRLRPKAEDRHRLTQSVRKALKEGNGLLLVIDEAGKPFFYSKRLMCPDSGIAYDDPAPNMFSFNSPYGACPKCEGLGVIEHIPREAIFPDPDLSIKLGAIAPLGEYRDIWIFKKIAGILKQHGYKLTTPVKKLPEEVINILLYGSKEKIAVPSKKYPGEEWETDFEGIIPFLERQLQEGTTKIRDFVGEFVVSEPCPECQGARLKKESLYFKIDGKNIAEVAAMDLHQLDAWLSQLPGRLNPTQRLIAGEVLKEISKRVHFLLDVGLYYLTLDRPMRTLSGGEAQRIRLATQIGTQLTGVLYLLDEPSIGLHQRDNEKLIRALEALRDIGNSVIVVEHDKDMMLVADHLIDIGPGAGRHGGRVVAQGSPQEVMDNPRSATALYLKGERQIEVPAKRRRGNGKMLILKGARGHNLKDITVRFPLGTMIGITGVSGSGKSSLIHHTLFPILRKHFYRSQRDPLPYDSIEGLEHIDKVIEIDQAPIGRTPRSNPATYTGVFTHIRNLFKDLPEAKIRGYKAGRFSFNVKGGRCEACGGAGVKTIEMEFLPDVQVLCDVCKGKRYNRETLEVRYKGKSIADVLDMTIEEAATFFENHPQIARYLTVLNEVGLGYLTLGQPATTLSGGEAQRIKLATELARKSTGNTFYILDEPTTGLHFQDIERLLDFLNRLVEQGNTVLIIEHNLDVIKVCDHLIDLGPEGGAQGGTIVCEGTPEEVAAHPHSHTGRFLRMELKQGQFAGK